jgi:hypothetical protein
MLNIECKNTRRGFTWEKQKSHSVIKNYKALQSHREYDNFGKKNFFGINPMCWEVRKKHHCHYAMQSFGI